MQIKANEILSEPIQPNDTYEELPEENAEQQPSTPPKESLTTMKKIIWVCLINGFAWVWCSYILAAMDKVQIAESLSQVAVTEIIGVVLAYAIKSVLENLSKNNNWPDKSDKDPPAVG